MAGRSRCAFTPGSSPTPMWCSGVRTSPAGAPIAAAGTVLTPAHIGVLAGQGIPDAEVFRPLTVGVFATGSELLEAGEAWLPARSTMQRDPECRPPAAAGLCRGAHPLLG